MTIDVQNKLKIFWDEDGINDVGRMIEKCWLDLKCRFGIELDEYVVMPDHFHGIVVIPWQRAAIKAARTLNPGNVGAGFIPTQDVARTLNPGNVGVGFMSTRLGNIIGSFKSIATGKYVVGVREYNWPRFYGRLWQRDYYERIIRNKSEFVRIRKYIQDNQKNLKS